MGRPRILVGFCPIPGSCPNYWFLKGLKLTFSFNPAQKGTYMFFSTASISPMWENSFWGGNTMEFTDLLWVSEALCLQAEAGATCICRAVLAGEFQVLLLTGQKLLLRQSLKMCSFICTAFKCVWVPCSSSSCLCTRLWAVEIMLWTCFLAPGKQQWDVLPVYNKQWRELWQREWWTAALQLQLLSFSHKNAINKKNPFLLVPCSGVCCSSLLCSNELFV